MSIKKILKTGIITLVSLLIFGCSGQEALDQLLVLLWLKLISPQKT